jgi:hypothetical protein
MRTASTISRAIAVLTLAGSAGATEIWSGYDVSFAKANFADWTLPANQDRITNALWLARADSQGMFNIQQESAYERFVSPTDTEWGYGTTDDIPSITFQDWGHAVGFSPPSSVGLNMVVHIISEDIYIDIRFTSWTSGSSGQTNGGGYSYVRAAGPPPACIGDLDGDGDTDIFDFGIFAAHFAMTVPVGTNGDLDGDGDVDIFDFGLFAPDFACGT